MKQTRKEWMRKNHPELVSPHWDGGVCGCPYDYGLTEHGDCCAMATMWLDSEVEE